MKFRTEYETTEEIALYFAKVKGYKEKISQENEEGYMVDVNNPQTYIEFIKEHMRGLIANELNSVTQKSIEEQLQIQANEQIKNSLEQIKSGLTFDVE